MAQPGRTKLCLAESFLPSSSVLALPDLLQKERTAYGLDTLRKPPIQKGESLFLSIGHDACQTKQMGLTHCAATVRIQGRNIHPGYAKDKMLNAILIGMELNSLLPAAQRPEHTDGYEGFFHIIGFNGTVEKAEFSYIIRDHDTGLFEKRKETIRKCVDFINGKYGDGTATVEIRHQYYNMRKEVEPHYHIIEKAVKAMEDEGITPVIRPIRGGTDGANLSFMGLPCPNIFAGGHNFHGKMEFVPVESMEKAVKVILNIISRFCGEE